jgi:hypothetical protein
MLFSDHNATAQPKQTKLSAASDNHRFISPRGPTQPPYQNQPTEIFQHDGTKLIDWPTNMNRDQLS